MHESRLRGTTDARKQPVTATAARRGATFRDSLRHGPEDVGVRTTAVTWREAHAKTVELLNAAGKKRETRGGSGRTCTDLLRV